MTLGGRSLQVGTTICYEGIFPEISRTFARAGAELMVNITNDAWYGVSSAATQHLLMYALRAVESGRPVARAANTGISGWIDVRGRIHDPTPVYTEQALVVDVPIYTENTVFDALGEWVALPCVLFIVPLWILSLLGPGFRSYRRRRVDTALGFVGFATALLALTLYFCIEPLLHPEPHVDEIGATRTMLLVIAGLLVGTGAWSARAWGRRAQRIIGAQCVVFGALAIYYGAPVVGAGLVVIGVFLVAVHVRSAEHFRRPSDPVLPIDPIGTPIKGQTP